MAHAVSRLLPAGACWIGFLLAVAWGLGGEGPAPVVPRAAVEEPAERAEIPSVVRRDAAALDDPSRDGWRSEAEELVALRCLRGLGDVLIGTASPTGDAIAQVVDAAFASPPLRPVRTTVVYRDAGFEVRRGEPPAAAASCHGPEGLRRALADLGRALKGLGQARCAWKIIGIEDDAAALVTQVVLEAAAKSDDASVQVVATWRCRWRRLAADGLALLSIEPLTHEEGEFHGPGGALFADETRQVLGGNACWSRQLAHGVHAWLDRIEFVQGMEMSARYGLAVGDADGDRRDDLYVCQPGGLPNRLFVQQVDGTLLDRSAAAGVDWLDRTSAALFVDLDNDGDQDLVLSPRHGVLVMENDGAGKFAVRARLAPCPAAQSLTAADYDLDGDLDVFLCVLKSAASGGAGPEARPFDVFDAQDGGPNQLLRNDGRWRFTDVTRESGLDTGNRRHSTAACWEDYDQDGDPDLYVANDYGRNFLFQNTAGHFTDVAEAVGAHDPGFGMSVDWGDADGDGRMDLYVGNMFSSAGLRIVTKPEFRAGATDGSPAFYQRYAKGSSLLLQRDGGRFEDYGAAAGVERARWAWSSNFVDVNNDGALDLMVANGYYTAEDAADL